VLYINNAHACTGRSYVRCRDFLFDDNERERERRLVCIGTEKYYCPRIIYILNSFTSEYDRKPPRGARHGVRGRGYRFIVARTYRSSRSIFVFFCTSNIIVVAIIVTTGTKRFRKNKILSVSTFTALYSSKNTRASCSEFVYYVLWSAGGAGKQWWRTRHVFDNFGTAKQNSCCFEKLVGYCKFSWWTNNIHTLFVIKNENILFQFFSFFSKYISVHGDYANRVRKYVGTRLDSKTIFFYTVPILLSRLLEPGLEFVLASVVVRPDQEVRSPHGTRLNACILITQRRIFLFENLLPVKYHPNITVDTIQYNNGYFVRVRQQ